MTAREETVAVRGLAPLIRDMSRVSKTATKALRSELANIGEPVAVTIRGLETFERFGDRTVTGVKAIVRQRGVSVEQTRRKSRNVSLRRPNFGPLQQTEFDKGLAEHAGQIAGDVDAFLDKFLTPVSGSLL